MKLRLTFLLVITILCQWRTIHAQDSLHSRFSIGIQGGMATAQLVNAQDKNNPNEIKYGKGSGYAYGINVGYTFYKGLGVSILPVYNVIHQSYTGNNAVTDNQMAAYTASTQLKYLQLPVMLTYRVIPVKKLYITVGAGMYYAWLLNSTDNFNEQFAQHDTLYTLTNTVENKTATYTVHTNKGYNTVLNTSLSHSVYSCNIFGTKGVLDMQYKVSKHISMGLAIYAEYSFEDIEYKKYMAETFTDPIFGVTHYNSYSNYYINRSSKFINYNTVDPTIQNKRGATALQNAGICLGIFYNL